MKFADAAKEIEVSKLGYRVQFTLPNGAKDQTPEVGEEPLKTISTAEKFARTLATKHPEWKDVTILKGDTGLPVKGAAVFNATAAPSSNDNVS